MQSDYSDSLVSQKAPVALFVAVLAIFLLGFLGARDPGNNGLAGGVFAQELFVASSEIDSRTALASGSPELVLIGQIGLKPSTPPGTVTPRILGAIVGQVESDLKPEVLEYAIEEGDTIDSVAKKFNISADTILWANDLQKTSPLVPGKVLIILPIAGTLHLVRSNDTLSEIASWYKADADEIVEFNHLASGGEIFAGDFLIIPEGIMPKTLPQGRLTPLPNSYFIYPIPAPYRITQGLHPFNAVDMSNGACGESVYAGAGGTVQRTGYTGLGGNYVRIIHPNGVVSYYGHLSAILTAPGAKVFQGQLIGYTGRTGRATGCHLHFEVRGASNPFAK
ncbi:MAG: M23 family metallopeptidase [Candidatus Wildermuthbacteria bacterium]|nr:M23 family metallopeptidase [Candidatus Wildermuthbacteria bacterium]